MNMSDLIADTRRTMYGSMADQLNFVNAPYGAGDGQITMLLDVGNITQGMVLSSGLNVWYVIGTDPGAKIVNVMPSYDNSRNDALPVGAPVMIRPRVTDWLVFTYLNDVIRSLSSPVHGLYRLDQWEADVAAPWNSYPVPAEAAGMVSIERVSAKAPRGDLWFEVPMKYIDWQPENGVVRIMGWTPAASALRFDYKAPFLTATDLTDDVEDDLGLPASMHDIPALGAAARLLRTTESRRTQIHNQGDPRRADEVPPSSNSSIARELSRVFEKRIDDERSRLVARNPYRMALPR